MISSQLFARGRTWTGFCDIAAKLGVAKSSTIAWMPRFMIPLPQRLRHQHPRQHQLRDQGLACIRVIATSVLIAMSRNTSPGVDSRGKLGFVHRHFATFWGVGSHRRLPLLPLSPLLNLPLSPHLRQRGRLRSRLRSPRQYQLRSPLRIQQGRAFIKPTAVSTSFVRTHHLSSGALTAAVKGIAWSHIAR